MDLLEREAKNSGENAKERLERGLQASIIRSQARYAKFHYPSNYIKTKSNWPIQDWVWQIRTGQLLLEEDRYIAVIDEFAPPAQVRAGEFANVWKIELFELKIHEAEMVKHLDIDLSAPLPKVPNTSLGITDCTKWLINEFQRDSKRLLKKSHFEAAALKQFPGRLNPQGFRQAWKVAVVQDPARAKGGRRHGT